MSGPIKHQIKKGTRFGMLTALREVYVDGRRNVLLRCECGNEVTRQPHRLRPGKPASCGCKKFGKPRIKVSRGQRFGRLRIIREVPGVSRQFLLRCDCGKKTTVSLNKLRRRHTTSCGCYRHERQIKANTTHGYSNMPGYYIWQFMMKRCYDVEHPAYPDYGGRGIKVCKEWRKNFPAFSKWYVENGGAYKNGLQLERVENDVGYTPWNCRMATRSEQNRNKRNNIWVRYKGMRVLLIDLWEKFGRVNYLVTQRRYRRGMSLRYCLLKPSKDTSYSRSHPWYEPRRYGNTRAY